MAFLLAILWSSLMPPVEAHSHWGFFLPWAVALALTLRLSWLSGFHLAILTAFVWAVLNAEPLSAWLGCGRGEIAVLYILVALLLWLGSLRVSARSTRFGSAMEAYGVVVAFTLLWVLQASPAQSETSTGWIILVVIGLVLVGLLALAEMRAARLTLRDVAGIDAFALSAALYSTLAASSPGTVSWIYAALFIALSIWLVAYGSNRRSRFALNAGFVAFAGEVLYLYFETLGTLLGTAAFFALGGVILIAGAYVLTKVRSRVVKAVNEGGAQ